jgi:peroxiredoxin
MALQVGDVAPDFKLPSATGEKAGNFQLSSFRGRKNVVLAFYPLDFTPVCSLEMPAFEKSLQKFSSSNAEVVGISTDSIACHVAFQKSLGGLTYPLLSDKWPYGEVAKAYGVFPAAQAPQLGVNERAVFVVDKEGKIAWARVYQLGQQPDEAEVLEALRKLA